MQLEQTASLGFDVGVFLCFGDRGMKKFVLERRLFFVLTTWICGFRDVISRCSVVSFDVRSETQ